MNKLPYFPAAYYHEDRVPTEEEEADIARLCKLSVSSAEIAMTYEKETGKVFSTKDIDNIRQR